MAVDKIQAAILAGGQSRRMGQDKSFIPLNGKPMIQHVVDTLQTLHLECMIITNAPGKYMQFGLPLFTDAMPGNGSIGGLYTALAKATSDYVLCVACDMPFLNAALLKYLMRRCEDYDAIVPVADGIVHNLHAIYSVRCLPVIRRQMEQGNLRISDFYEPLNVRYVIEPEVRAIDPDLASLVNMNTPYDVQQAANKV